VGREHVFVEGCVLVFHLDNCFFQKWEGDLVARAEDNDIDGLLLRAIVENDRVVLEFLHTWLDSDPPCKDVAWKVVIQYRLAHQAAVESRGALSFGDHEHALPVPLLLPLGPPALQPPGFTCSE